METSVVSELEGTLLKNGSLFSYFMLVSFDSSVVGLLCFTLLLLLRPLLFLLEDSGMEDSALNIMVFVSLVGMTESEIESVGRAVLPRFYMDDIDTEAWRVFRSYGKRVVVTRAPRVMVEVFGKKHLQADEVIGAELVVGRFGYSLGWVQSVGSVSDRVTRLIDKTTMVGMGRTTSSTFLHLCKEQFHPPFTNNHRTPDDPPLPRPNPVIFHDGRLVKRLTPLTPLTSLLILLWLPLGITLATIRITVELLLPFSIIPIVTPFLGGKVIVKGNPPPPGTSKNSAGVLFVCTHRTLMDPVVLSTVLGRKIPAVTYSLSRFSEILSPIPTVRLTRIREVDSEKIKHQLAKTDVVVCPEGTTCREPFLLRFSALFAELTDGVVPVAINYRVGFFHGTTVRGWKSLDPVFFMMNPRPVYEVTFLNQLPDEVTCSSGKSPHDVANHVQRILAATLGFECTNFT